jgi:hypothetical protein
MEIISRSTHDAIIKSIADNISTISQDVKAFSAQAEIPRTTPNPVFLNTLDAPIVTPDPAAPCIPMPSAPQTTFTRLPLPQLPQTDYPNVQLWFPDDYNDDRRGGKRGGEDEDEAKKDQGGSVLSRFMENENGKPIPNGARRAIRATAKSFFEQILLIGRAPTSWGQAGLDIRNELIHQLESEYHWIRLCDGHWKAMKVATNIYSHWYGPASRRRAAEATRQEFKKSKTAAPVVHSIDVDVDDNDEASSSKRPQTEDDNTRAPKRPRIEDHEPPSSPRPRPTNKEKRRQMVCGIIYLILYAAKNIQQDSL